MPLRSRLARRPADPAAARRAKRRRRAASRAGNSGGPLLKISPRLNVTQMEAVPDLLGVEPRLTVDAAELCGTLDFAFAGGSCMDSLERALDDSSLPASDWQPECYAADLFIEEFVRDCFFVELDGWRASLNQTFLARVLSLPPSDMAVAAFRREIVLELTEDARVRQAFAQLYRTLSRLRQLFSNDAGTSRYEVTQRRIDILGLVRDVIEQAAAPFGQCDSGLRRIDALAQEVRSSPGYQHLLELLTYENELATVDVRMQLGIDGRVRKFEIVQLEENDQNAFYQSPLRRWTSKIKLWWRGYRFSNDELVDRWLDLVFTGISHFLPALVQLHGHMEVYLASLGFRDRCLAKGLGVCLPELREDACRNVEGMFNPLLFAQGVVPQPCEVVNDSRDGITVITGPNSGGKTRLLQSLGYTQLLGQVGLYAPASQATLRPATGMFVSLIDEPKADQKEGRLGSELIRVRRLFEMSRGGALILLDELCSGTNPSEGEEIFFLVLTLLAELSPEAFISTHFLEFARRLASEQALPKLRFLQVELDEHQRPTYGFIPGVASTSLATQTAARLGVTREELMALVARNKRRDG